MKGFMAAVAFALLACGDFELVPRRTHSTTPSVQINVSVNHEMAASAYAFYLGFTPGIDSVTGMPYVIADSSILVGDSVIMHDRVLTDAPLRLLEYDWAVVRDSAQPPIDTLTIRLPVLAGSVAGNHIVRLALPRRGDAAQLTLTNEVALHVTDYAVGSDLADSTRYAWLLELRKKCFQGTAFVSISGSTVFPNELRVPRSWLPATTTDSAMVCFYSSASFRVRDVAIPTTVYRQTNIQWLLRLP